jgi:hypothetical protein
MGIVSLVALLAVSSAQAEPHKKKSKSTKAESSSSISMMAVATPSSLVAPPPPVDSAPPPADPKPAITPPASGAPPSADSPPDAEADGPRINLMPMVAFGLEPQLEGRIFRQSEGPVQDPRQYGAMGYASIALAGELYPLVNVKPKFWRGFGVTLSFARALGFQSSGLQLSEFGDQSIPPVDTTFMRYAVGLRYRMHVNPESETPVVLGISASWRRWQFTFSPEQALGSDVETPTADYRMGRVGFDGAVEVKRVTFYGAAYYLHAFSVGAPNMRELERVTSYYLADAPGMGGEFRGAVGVRLARWIELRLSVEYAIMAFHLKSLEENGPPATVLDSYLSAGLGPYVSF